MCNIIINCTIWPKERTVSAKYELISSSFGPLVGHMSLSNIQHSTKFIKYCCSTVLYTCTFSYSYSMYGKFLIHCITLQKINR